MEPNVGGYDRLGRLLLGAVLVAVAVAGYAGFVRLSVGPLLQALTAAGVALIGLVLLVTGASRRCPLNSVLGVDTCGNG